MYRSNMVDLCVFVFVCSSVSYIAKTVDWQSKNRAVTVPLCANASWSPAQRDLTTSDKAVEYRTGTLLFLCWNDTETGWSTQRANDRYKDHLNGQLISTEQSSNDKAVQGKTRRAYMPLYIEKALIWLGDTDR